MQLFFATFFFIVYFARRWSDKADNGMIDYRSEDSDCRITVSPAPFQ